MSSAAQELTPQPQKSTHRCEVVFVHPEKHPNADKLAVAMVYGYSVCIGINDFKDGDLGVYIPPDSVVPERDEFKWIWEAKGYSSAPYVERTQFHGTADLCSLGQPPVPEKYRRVKAKILRGVVSEGLLLPLSSVGLDKKRWALNGIDLVDESQTGYAIEEGEDVAEVLGITHYEPPDQDSLRTDCEKGPMSTRRAKHKGGYPKTIKGWYRFIKHWLFPGSSVYGRAEEDTQFSYHIPIYDIDAWQRYKHLLKEGEEVWLTEKIHGANCRFTYINESVADRFASIGRMYVGSHRQWKRDVSGCAFWEGMRQNPWIESFCRQHPGLVLYGELVPTQTLNYGQEKGKYRVFGFDVLDPTQGRGKWLSHDELKALKFQYPYWDGHAILPRELLDSAHWVPTVAIIPYGEASIREWAGGQSLVKNANHLREGIVIKPTEERFDPHFGRVILKIVSPTYLASKHSE
jgi:RNA ligase (TIGR02306 family)